MSAFTTAALLLALQFGQSASGELRLVVRDSSGLPVTCRRYPAWYASGKCDQSRRLRYVATANLDIARPVSGGRGQHPTRVAPGGERHPPSARLRRHEL